MRSTILFVLCLLSDAALGRSPGSPSHARIFTTWKDNPHCHHTFFAPSAIPLPQGQGYYSNSYIIMHSAWYAPLDNVSIGGGFQMMSLRPQQNALPGFYLALKAGKRIQPGVHVGIYAVGSQLSTDPPFQDTLDTGRKMGAVMAQGTFGTNEAHVTLNFGWGTSKLGFSEKPMFGVSAQWRFTEPLAVITENWVLNYGPDPFPIYSGGIRYLHRKLGADAGLVYNEKIAEGFGAVIPYLGFSLRF